MFYYPNVLNYRTGSFSTIWLAATKFRKINRRDLLKVNVHSTCNDIMDYILVRVAPLSLGLPRPRFSLYLSSQLQYGVVLIFHRQCQLLLDEIQEAIDRFLRHHRQVQIDMLPEELRQHHTFPDALSLLNETEGARDPFFGSMVFGMPSPSTLIQLAEQMGEPSLPLDGITASQESITLAETEPAPMPEPEFEGVELQEFDMIDMLLEQPDHFPEGEQEKQREGEREREREQEKEQVEAIHRELPGSTISLELVSTSEVSTKDVVFEPEEVSGLPMEEPELAKIEQTQSREPLPIPPTPPSKETQIEGRRESPMLEPAPISFELPVQPRKRRRQLVFIDEHTQIPQDVLQAQINDPHTETKSLPDILIKAPARDFDPKTLFTDPCMTLPPDILELWKQHAVIHPIHSPPQREEEEVEEEAVPEQERKEPQEMMEDLISEEVFREMESVISQKETQVSSLIIYKSSDRLLSPLETPEFQRSTVLATSLEDITEEKVPEPEEMSIKRQVTFHSMLPLKVNRRTVAQAFWRLLERIKMKKYTVRQDEPYGDIIITNR